MPCRPRLRDRPLGRAGAVVATTVALASCDLVLGLEDFRGPGASIGGAPPVTSSGGGGTGGSGGATVGGGGQPPGVPQGEVLWVRAVSATSRQLPRGLSVAADGTVFMGGYLSGAVPLVPEDRLTPGGVSPCVDQGITLSAVRTSPFVAAFDAEGCTRWGTAWPVGTTGLEVGQVTDLVSVSSGALWVAGHARDEITIAGQTTTTLGRDWFWAEIDTNASAGTSVVVLDHGIDVRGDDQVTPRLAAGDEMEPFVAAVDNAVIESAQLSDGDVFVRPMGTLAPSWNLATGGLDEALAIAPFEGDLLVAGSVGPNATFGGSCANASEGGGFVARVGTDGTCKWRHVLDSSEDGRAVITSIATRDVEPKIFLGGHFDDQVTFPDGTTILAPRVDEPQDDAFIAALAGDGSWGWAVSSQGQGEEQIRDLTFTPSGDLAVAGTFTESLGFTNDSAPQGWDGYLLLLSPDRMPAARWSVVLRGPALSSFTRVRASAGRVFAIGSYGSDADGTASTLGPFTLPFDAGDPNDSSDGDLTNMAVVAVAELASP